MIAKTPALLLSALLLFAASPAPPAPPTVPPQKEKPAPPADFLEPPADAVRSENGLVTRVLAAGTGTEKPEPPDTVTVRYTVWDSDAKTIDHVPAPREARIAVAKMLPGWRQAVMEMVVGEQRRIWIPATLGGGRIMAGKSFIFDTELLGILKPPVTPADVAAPPADAETSESGLAWKVLRPGTGTEHPKRRSTVRVHYTGWTTDGRMFESSILRGDPAQFQLDGVIPGWTEGLQLMTAGEVRRFWIPSKLAYRNAPGKPKGMLVFDIELLEVVR